MDNNKLVGREFSSHTVGTKDKDGYWTLAVTMTEKVIYPDGTEIEEKIESECVDMDFDIAHQIALHSSLGELARLVYDRNLDSLIEGMALEREKSNDSSENNEDTPTQ